MVHLRLGDRIAVPAHGVIRKRPALPRLNHLATRAQADNGTSQREKKYFSIHKSFVINSTGGEIVEPLRLKARSVGDDCAFDARAKTHHLQSMFRPQDHRRSGNNPRKRAMR
jgi:hypothetical protein